MDEQARTRAGARKEKSKRLAGAAIETKPSMSGRRMSKCMAIQEPNDTAAIQLTRPFWFYAACCGRFVTPRHKMN